MDLLEIVDDYYAELKTWCASSHWNVWGWVGSKQTNKQTTLVH